MSIFPICRRDSRRSCHRRVALIGALLGACIVPASASAAPHREAASNAGHAPQATASRAGADCAAIRRRAKRMKHGARRRAAMRHYDTCRQARSYTPTPTSQPPSVARPNPAGYQAYNSCQPVFEASYQAAGFSCQIDTYVSFPYSNGYTTSYVNVAVYLLFPICTDNYIRKFC